MSYGTDGPQVGWIVLAGGEVVPPEEYERRQAALTPAQRELQAKIAGHFAREAQALRKAPEGLAPYRRQGEADPDCTCPTCLY